MKLLLALTALLALAPAPADSIVFGPEKGTKLEKRFGMSMTLEKRSMSMSVGGQDLPAELLEGATMNLSQSRTIEVADEYREIDGDRPELLARTYTKLSDATEQKVLMMGMEEAQEEKKDRESDLEDQTVLFRWNEKESKFDKEWVGEGADDELLGDLEEDMDLRSVVPGKAVAVGDTWKVDLEEFGDVFGPGGDFGFKSDDDDDDEDETDFEDNLKGDVTCTYKGIQEVEGRKLARIAAVCTAKTFQDEDAKEDQPAMHMEFDISMEGEFLWDIAGKHMASYKLDGEVESDMKLTQELDMNGQTGQLLVKIELAGKIALEGEFKAK